MTMTITFTGTAAELRAEMRVLLGFDTAPVVADAVAEQSVEQQVEQAFGVEPKRSRGRPRKTETPPAEYVVEPVVEAEQPVVEVEQPVVEEAPAPQPEVKEEASGTSVSSPVEPEPEVVEPVAQPDDTPANAQDLMTACMSRVAGDSSKKMALVKLLQSFDAKTINTLAAEYYAEFWAKVKEL